ncbi:hypothetical protein CCP3SC5AM1_220012 [Gammaproteobacteria bacterium]
MIMHEQKKSVIAPEKKTDLFSSGNSIPEKLNAKTASNKTSSFFSTNQVSRTEKNNPFGVSPNRRGDSGLSNQMAAIAPQRLLSKTERLNPSAPKVKPLSANEKLKSVTAVSQKSGTTAENEKMAASATIIAQEKNNKTEIATIKSSSDPNKTEIAALPPPGHDSSLPKPAALDEGTEKTILPGGSLENASRNAISPVTSSVTTENSNDGKNAALAKNKIADIFPNLKKEEPSPEYNLYMKYIRYLIKEEPKVASDLLNLWVNSP